MSRRAQRSALLVILVTGLGLAIGLFVLYRCAAHYPDRPAGTAGNKITVTVPAGVPFPVVVATLAERQLVGNPMAFRLYVNYKGQAQKIRAGTYTFPSEITPRQLLEILVHGVASPTVSVLIPEGKNMLEVADLLAEAKIAPRAALVREMRNRRFLARLSIPGETIEGHLFPDTYKLRATMPPQEVLAKLASQHKLPHALLG